MRYSQSITYQSFKPLREVVYESIREAILKGELRQGERLMETHLAEEIGVSRTPIREAIRKLELEGLLVMIPRKGAYVAEISLDDVIDVFEIRAALESLAAELAVKRITTDELEKLENILRKEQEQIDVDNVGEFVELDTEFHETIFTASRNKKLCQMINNMREHIQRYRTVSLAYENRMKVALKEHLQIMDALKEGEDKKVAELARKHIESAENAFMAAIENYSNNKRGNSMKKVEEEDKK